MCYQDRAEMQDEDASDLVHSSQRVSQVHPARMGVCLGKVSPLK